MAIFGLCILHGTKLDVSCQPKSSGIFLFLHENILNSTRLNHNSANITAAYDIILVFFRENKVWQFMWTVF